MCPYKDQSPFSNSDASDIEIYEVDTEPEMADSDDSDLTDSDMSSDHDGEEGDTLQSPDSPDSSDEPGDPIASMLQISSDTRQIRAELERLIDELANGLLLDFVGLENIAGELQELLVQIDERLPRLCPFHAWQSIFPQLHTVVEELRDALLRGCELFGKREE